MERLCQVLGTLGFLGGATGTRLTVSTTNLPAAPPLLGLRMPSDPFLLILAPLCPVLGGRRQSIHAFEGYTAKSE